jgi:hypothetical protein
MASINPSNSYIDASISNLKTYIDQQDNLKASKESPTFTGTITTALSEGVVHSNASGTLNSSLIVGNDIANNTITISKLLNTDVSTGNVANTLVLRDQNGFLNGSFSGLFNGSIPVVPADTIHRIYPGVPGQITVDTDGILYVCVSTNTWSKVSLNNANF